MKLHKPTPVDWLPIYRIVTAPILIVLALTDQKDIFKWMILISFLSDAVDGYLARKFNMTSQQGAILDSWGDMFTLVAAVVGIFSFEWEYVREHSLAIGIALGLYVLQLVIAVVKYGKPSSFHTYAAKTAAIVQGIFLIGTFFFGIFDWLFWLTIAIAIFETLEETILIFVLPKWETDVKGLYWVMKRKFQHQRA